MTWVHISILSLLLAMWAVFWMVRNEVADLNERINTLERRITAVYQRLSKLESVFNQTAVQKNIKFVYEERSGEVLVVPNILNRPEVK